MPNAPRVLLVVLFLCSFAIPLPAQNGSRTRPEKVSEMRPAIERYTLDRGSLRRSYPGAMSPNRRARLKKFYEESLSSLKSLDFDSLSQDGKVDYLLFKNHLEYELRQLAIQEKQIAEIQPLIPFAATIIELEEARRRMEPINSGKTAATLTELKKQVDEQRRAVEKGFQGKKTVANRAVAAMTALRNNLRNWSTFYNGYDPLFTWWNEEPYRSLDQALTNYSNFVAEKIVGIRVTQSEATRGPGSPGPQRQSSSPNARPGDTSDIVGDPIGREALISELRSEMIPYTPEEIIAIGAMEMAWWENEGR